MKKGQKLSTTIKIALLSALSFLLLYAEIPYPLFPWLKLGISDVPALLGGFAFGPMAGVTIEFFKILLNLLMEGTNTGFIGEIANFIVGVALVLPASLIYWKNKSKKSAAIGLIVGIIALEIVGIFANVYLLLPAYGMVMDSAKLLQYVTIGLLPFNGIKGVVVSLITFITYKKLSTTIFKGAKGFENEILGTIEENN